MPNLGKRWLSTSKIPLYNEQKQIIGTIGWFNDITEIKELKIELNEKNQLLYNYNIELTNATEKERLSAVKYFRAYAFTNE